MSYKTLTALPVYNEESHLEDVLSEVVNYADHILVVDDGSSDRTAEFLESIVEKNPKIVSTRHQTNLGYGAALNTAFQWAIDHEFDALVTIDCDGQHQPAMIPEFAAALKLDSENPYDIVSGSRYLKEFDGDSLPPEDRRGINVEITKLLNERLGLDLTDTFCGLKSYRTESLKKLNITNTGYAMPLQLWVQAVAEKFQIIEHPVRLIYLEEERSFGGSLDDSVKRKAHYMKVINQELEATGL